jgi:hypothetical protein
MKFSEFNERFKSNVLAYIKETFDLLRYELRETKGRILGYLFGLNAGGLVAAAAYLNVRGSTGCKVIWAVAFFVFGLAMAVIRAAIDYHDCERVFSSLHSRRVSFYDGSPR